MMQIVLSPRWLLKYWNANAAVLVDCLQKKIFDTFHQLPTNISAALQLVSFA